MALRFYLKNKVRVLEDDLAFINVRSFWFVCFSCFLIFLIPAQLIETVSIELPLGFSFETVGVT